MSIYTISLANQNINDESLAKLLRSTQSRCIILLDDIDVTALNDPAAENDLPEQDDYKHHDFSELFLNDEEHDSGGLTSSTDSLQNLCTEPGPHKATKSQQQIHRVKRQRLTRGGFLNATDGVCGPTGHILIITTNFPEKIDPVLVRPGRIDMKVEFGRANREQVREIFLKTTKPFVPEDLKKYDRKKMEALADKFTAKVPEFTLSPAQVQQCCTEYIDEPDRAVKEVLRWIKDEKRQTAEIARYQQVSQQWTVQG